MVIYRLTEFASLQNGHGGQKRTLHIEKVLNGKGFEIIDVDSKNELNSNKSKFQRLLRTIQFLVQFKISIKNLQHFKKIHTLIIKADNICTFYKKGSVFLYEHSRFSNWLFPVIANQYGHKVIANIHNIETLVPDQVSLLKMTKSPDGFLEEIKMLEACKLALTISKEENWLLKLFNIHSIYVPYEPTVNEKEELQTIKDARKVRDSDKSFLIFGSASNNPTRKGMIELIKVLQNFGIENHTYHIAGYGTDSLKKDLVFKDNFIFHGAISITALHDFYKSVDAVLIHQPCTTGALTKIPELLYSNIPIIANSYASRNYYNTPGVFTYWSFEELKKILSEQLYSKTSFGFQIDNDVTISISNEMFFSYLEA